MALNPGNSSNSARAPSVPVALRSAAAASSGASERDRGVSKAGSRLVRAVLVEIAWIWLRFQPRSALSQWYQRRFAGGGPRIHRIGIVALARRLLIALWRYLEDGVIPQDAPLIASEI